MRFPPFVFMEIVRSSPGLTCPLDGAGIRLSCTRLQWLTSEMGLWKAQRKAAGRKMPICGALNSS
jgi:hypothetical protein